ncbi:hypothetical protein ACSVH2_06275 [Flavobacterium sp. RSB2_4_14]|uniref:hypothetical protein n=1 Tax=Flavobacterium sp. RSB2_4_14 TaxID=3447665 RepID=UPI003F3A30F2
MKRIKLLLFATILVISVNIKAQVTASFNFGTPPVWAPQNAEPAKFYYLPEIETYYDVPSRRYIYVRNGSWFRSATLPAQYRNYNLAKGQTVYITNYRGNYPYYYFKQHKVKYHKNNNSFYKSSYTGKGNYKGNAPKNGNYKPYDHDNGNNHNNAHKNKDGNKHDNEKNHDNGNKQGKGKK